MNLYQLRYFITVAQLQNMSKAAELLHLSQSSLSKSIAKLEAEIAMPLFNRTGKKITLNPQGERFLECSLTVIRETEQALDQMRLLGSGSGSSIKIGSAGANGRLADCIHRFVSLCPQAEFDLNCNIESLEHIDINEYDALLYPAGLKYEKFSGYPLGPERFLLAVSKLHPLSKKPVITMKDLWGQHFIFLRSGKNYVEYPYRVCNALAVPMAGQDFTDLADMHRQMIRGGACVGFVSSNAAAAYETDPLLRLLPVQDVRFCRETMLCFRREKHLSPLAKAFKAYALSYFHLSPSDTPPAHP